MADIRHHDDLRARHEFVENICSREAQYAVLIAPDNQSWDRQTGDLLFHGVRYDLLEDSLLQGIVPDALQPLELISLSLPMFC